MITDFGLKLKYILLVIGLLFSNFIIPDFGLQLGVSFLIGMILPDRIIEPIDNILRKIPPIRFFERKMRKHKKFKHIFPRILAGYLFTYIIGWTCLILAYLL